MTMGLILAGTDQELATDNTNPFFSPYKTPLNTPPFNLIKTEHFLPAIKEGIRQQQAEIDAHRQQSGGSHFRQHPGGS